MVPMAFIAREDSGSRLGRRRAEVSLIRVRLSVEVDGCIDDLQDEPEPHAKA